MSVIIYGTRHYGRVEEHGGEHAHTRFFHLWFMPLFPVGGSSWVIAQTANGPLGQDTRLHWKSVAACYLRVWGPIAALMLLVGGLKSTALLLPAALGATALVGWSWSWLGVGGRNARRRSDFNLAAFGMRCEPRRLKAAVRADLKRDLDRRWGEASPGRSPNEVALHGATNANQAALAYGLLRLAALERGEEAPAADLAAARILAGKHDVPGRDNGPFRASPEVAVGGTSDAALADLVLRVSATRLADHVAAGVHMQSAEERERLARRRSRFQLAGLVVLSFAAVAGINMVIAAVKPTFEVTLRELRSFHPPTNRTVRVTCDQIHGPIWEEATSRGHVRSRIALCSLGEQLLPIKLDADDAIPNGPVVEGELRRVFEEAIWVKDGLRKDQELDARSLDVFVDTTARADDFLLGLAFAVSAPILWVLWFRAQRRRKRARSAARA